MARRRKTASLKNLLTCATLLLWQGSLLIILVSKHLSYWHAKSQVPADYPHRSDMTGADFRSLVIGGSTSYALSLLSVKFSQIFMPECGRSY